VALILAVIAAISGWWLTSASAAAIAVTNTIGPEPAG
jgi:hypothetical protein